jgi:hypothetical protein
MGVVGARPSSWTRACALLLVALAVAASGAHGTRAGPRGHRDRVGVAPAGAATARRSLLSKPGPSCCTHDPNTPGTSCCPQPFVTP